MAHAENGVGIFDFIRQHPGLAALATSSIGGPLLGVWTHNGANVPGYGKLLTASEAHGMPDYGSDTKYLPSSNIPPIDVFGHPNTVMYSPAPPNIASTYKLLTNAPTIQAFDVANNFATPEHTLKTFTTSKWLFGAVGIVAIIGIFIAGKNAFEKKRKKAMDERALIAFLQSERNKIKKENSALKEKLQHATTGMDTTREYLELKEEIETVTSRMIRSQAEISRLNKKVLNSKANLDTSRAALNTIQAELDTCEENLKICREDLKLSWDLHGEAELRFKGSVRCHNNSLQKLDEKTKEISRGQYKLVVKQVELKHVQDDRHKLQKQHDERMRQLQDAEEMVDDRRTEILHYQARITEQQRALEHVRKAWRKSQEQHFSLTQRIHEVELERKRSQDALRGAKAENDALSADLKRERTITREKAGIISELQDTEKKLRQACDDLGQARKAVDEKETFIIEFRRKEKQLQEDLNAKKATLKARDGEIDALKGTVKDQKAQIANLEKSIEETKVTMSGLQDKEKSFSDTVSEIATLRLQHEKDVSEILASKRTAADKDGEVARLNLMITELKSKLDTVEHEDRNKQILIQSLNNGAKVIGERLNNAMEAIKTKTAEVAQIQQERNDEMVANADLQEQFDAEVEQNERKSADQQKEIDELQEQLEKSRINAVKTQKQHDSILAQKIQEVCSHSQATVVERQKVLDLGERLEAKSKELEDATDELAALRLSNTSMKDDDTLSAGNKDSARAKPYRELGWSKRGMRHAHQWTLRKAIADRGYISPKSLVQLKLPHADPYYSELPMPIPKPCDKSAEGVQKTCDKCGETYLQNDYQDHGPACMVFFANYAKRCVGCNGVFHVNDAFQSHEKYCKQHETTGAAPQVLKELPYTSEHGVINTRNVEMPSNPSIQHIMSLKVSVLGNKSKNTLYRALPPYKDPDYDKCNLPRPNEPTTIISSTHTREKNWEGRKQCFHCTEWYLSQGFQAHVNACRPFFQGDGIELPHIRCEHCNDIYTQNDAFYKHRSICAKSPTAAACNFCGDVFKLADDILAKHKKLCYRNLGCGSISDAEKKAINLPSNTTTVVTQAPSLPASPVHPVQRHNSPHIATNGYHQPPPPPRLTSPYPSPNSAPLPASPAALSATAPPFSSSTLGTNLAFAPSPSPSTASRLMRPGNGDGFPSPSDSSFSSTSQQQQTGAGRGIGPWSSSPSTPTRPASPRGGEAL